MIRELRVCTDENGNGLANLLNTGLVTFWEDAGATIPITNPGAHPVQITGPGIQFMLL